jgi:putative hydrolase of the HAD superfamily
LKLLCIHKANQMPVKAILFDYGGVLVQVMDETPRQQLAERYGVPLRRIYHLLFDTEASIQAALGEISMEHHWRAIHEILRVPPGERADFIRQFWAADGLNRALVDFLPSLRERYSLGLLSNANDDLRQMMTEHWQIAGLFDDMIISAEVGLLKSDRRIYELAATRLGVQPDEALFIDDTPVNVEGARIAGLQAIQYLNNQQVLAELEGMLQVASGK